MHWSVGGSFLPSRCLPIYRYLHSAPIARESAATKMGGGPQCRRRCGSSQPLCQSRCVPRSLPAEATTLRLEMFSTWLLWESYERATKSSKKKGATASKENLLLCTVVSIKQDETPSNRIWIAYDNSRKNILLHSSNECYMCRFNCTIFKFLTFQ